MPPPDTRRIARRAFQAGAAARQLWFGVLVLAVWGLLPWLIALLRGFTDMGSVGVVLDALYLPACHRMSERSLTIGHAVMPICSRCAGVYLGLAVGAVAEWRLGRGGAQPASRHRITRLLLALLVAALLLAIEVAVQDTGLLPLSHTRRMLTGLLVGGTAAAALIASLGRNLSLAAAQLPVPSDAEKKS